MALRKFDHIYAFDASGLTDAASYSHLGVSLLGDPFYLHQITGLTTALASTGRWQLLQDFDTLTSSIGGLLRCTMFPILPEYKYIAGPNNSISFNLSNVLRATTGATPTYASQVIFQGLREYESFHDYQDGLWATLPFTYQYPLTIDWRYRAGGAVNTYKIEIDNYDFELCNISIFNADGTPATGADYFAFTLYNYAYGKMMSIPILQRGINFVGGWGAQFPTQPILYPNETTLQFDIQSLIDPLDATFPKSYYICFNGRRRIREKVTR